MRLPIVTIVLLAALTAGRASADECPHAVLFEPAGTGSTADTGWTGFSQDRSIFGNTLPLAVSCAPDVPPCGSCSITGLVAAPSATNLRCASDTSLACTIASEVADCGAAGECRLFLGPPQPTGVPGLTACYLNQLAGPIGGTVDVESGAADVVLPWTSTVHLNIDDPHQGCPRCVGDPTANDGLRGGTCDAGARNGQACDGNGVSVAPLDDFGTSSFDCPPSPGLVIATINAGPAHFATTTQTRTLSTENPRCTQTGATDRRCFCDTCNNAAAEPCQSDADCPPSGGQPGICGGKRCAGGANEGGPCTGNSACPSGVCQRPGEPTLPNSCRDDTSTAPDESFACTDTAPLGDGAGECLLGLYDEVCANHPDRTCSSSADCDDVPNSCVARARPCFVTDGSVGDSVSAPGFATPPVDGVSEPTALGMLTCLPAVAASALNSTVGLPGLTRNRQVGRLTFADEVVGLRVAPGGGASTSGSGDVAVTVVTPTGGAPTIVTTFPTGTPPPGQVLIGRVIRLIAPEQAPASPLVLTIALAATVIPPGHNAATIDVYRDGDGPIPNCIDPDTAIPNDPCVAARTPTGGGAAELTISSSTGGTFTLAADVGPPPCPPTPDVCRTGAPRKSSLRLTNRSPDTKDDLLWKLAQGAATATADFGDPLGADDYALCLYDASGLRTRLSIPAGGMCAGKDCWQEQSRGFVYRNRDATPHGVTKVTLRAGAAGKSQTEVKGKGGYLPLPTLTTLTFPLRVQLRNVASGICWGTTFGTPDQLTPTRLKARSD